MKYLFIFFTFLFSSCTYLSVEELTIDCTQNPILGVVTIIKATCGADDGGISIETTGGKVPYAYQVGDVIQTENVFNNLAAGTYQIIITDGNNCSTELEATVLNKDGVQAISTRTEAGCAVFQGKITVNASQGQSPYTYSLDDGNEQSSNTFTNLGHGIYQITVKDQLGCEFTIEEKLLSGVSYKQSIEPIMMGSCAVTGCHNGSQFPDLRTYNGVKSSSSRIKEFTQSGFMPQSGTLTQAQKDAIACWVDDGAKDN